MSVAWVIVGKCTKETLHVCRKKIMATALGKLRRRHDDGNDGTVMNLQAVEDVRR